jgi:hypothetical protein
VHVAAEPGRQAVREHLDGAAEGVTLVVSAVDPGDHAGGRLRVEAAHLGRVDGVEVVGARAGGVVGEVLAADVDDVGEDGGADLGEEALGDRADDDAGGGLAGGGALEGVADVVVAVLQRADEVGVPGPGAGEALAAAGVADGVEVVARLGVHGVDPLGPLGVVDHDADRRAERAAVPDAGEHLDAVDLEVHPGRAAVAEPAAGELRGEQLAGDGEAGRHPLEGGDEGGTVGLPSGQEAQARHADLTSGGGPAAYRRAAAVPCSRSR